MENSDVIQWVMTDDNIPPPKLPDELYREFKKRCNKESEV